MSRAIVFLADGFEECEGLIVVDLLRRANVEVMMASTMGRLEVRSSRNILIRADTLDSQVDYDSADLIVLPGGREGTRNLLSSDIVKEQSKRFAAIKTIAAICAAPSVLASIGLLEHRRATCHPDFIANMQGAILTGEKVCVDGNIITSMGLGTTFEFAFELVRMFAGEQEEKRIKKAICYN